jgi:hypothetical protein
MSARSLVPDFMNAVRSERPEIRLKEHDLGGGHQLVAEPYLKDIQDEQSSHGNSICSRCNDQKVSYRQGLSRGRYLNVPAENEVCLPLGWPSGHRSRSQGQLR